MWAAAIVSAVWWWWWCLWRSGRYGGGSPGHESDNGPRRQAMDADVLAVAGRLERRLQGGPWRC